MYGMTVSKDELSDSGITCAICQESFTDPIMLKCRVSVCVCVCVCTCVYVV